MNHAIVSASVLGSGRSTGSTEPFCDKTIDQSENVIAMKTSNKSMATKCLYRVFFGSKRSSVTNNNKSDRVVSSRDCSFSRC